MPGARRAAGSARADWALPLAGSAQHSANRSEGSLALPVAAKRIAGDGLGVQSAEPPAVAADPG